LAAAWVCKSRVAARDGLICACVTPEGGGE